VSGVEQGPYRVPADESRTTRDENPHRYRLVRVFTMDTTSVAQPHESVTPAPPWP
jgi:hypothetical protein